MGRTCDHLPPSEVLPDIGLNCVVYHNGKGYYYTCKDYSSHLDKRIFNCMRPDCKVVATMGVGLGSPLIDSDKHSHNADLAYRDKCIVLHTIRERFLQEGTSAFLILQEVIASISLEQAEDISASCDFESITFDEDTTFELLKEEDNPIDEEKEQISTESLESQFLLQPVKQTYCKSTANKEKPCENNKEKLCVPEPSTSESQSVRIEFVDVKTEEVSEEEDTSHPLTNSDSLDINQESEESVESRKKRKRKQKLEQRLGLDPPKKGRVCNCLYQCGQITHEEMLLQFNAFNVLDYNQQSAFLANGCVKVIKVKRHRVSEDISTRQFTVEYYFQRKENNIRVCKKTICNIFKITRGRLQILVEKIKFNKTLFYNRGSYRNHGKFSDEIRDLIKKHISSFPRQENQYSRNESQKECLDSRLSVKKLWELFRIQHPDSNVKLHKYRDIFNSDFNLMFGPPRSDTCM